MDYVTEVQFFAAVRIVNKYAEQRKKSSTEELMYSGITKTPNELREDPIQYFPKMDGRLRNILWGYFDDVRLCDITKRQFMSVRNAGIKSWVLLCNLTGNDPDK